jgi:ABC-type transport system involved in multi-copper enzyme maturation permease subunit
MLRFFTAALGPIFAKEMVEISRRGRYYFNRVFYGTVLLIGATMVWEENRWNLQRGVRLIEAMAELANELFLVVSCIQCGAALLFVPVFLCGVIASEREERTLELLFTTSLTDREIVLGKLASRLAVLGLMILSALPVLSLLMLFGGIDPATLWRVETATLVIMLFVGAHAIYFSATSRSPMGALLRTYWWLGLWLVAFPGFVIAILANTTPNPFVPICQVLLSILACVNPIGPFFLAIEPRLAGLLTSGLGAWASFLTSAVPVAWSVFLILQAIRHVRMLPGRAAVWRDRIPGVRFVRKVRQKWGGFASAVDRALLYWSRFGEVGNPIWQRSRLAPVYDRDGYLRRIESLSWLVAFAFFLLFAIATPRDLFDESGAMVFVAFAWGGVTLLTLVTSASGLVGDRRRGMLELMLVAPIEPHEFVDGSLRTIWEHIRRIYWLPIVLTGLFCTFGDPEIAGSLCSVITATLFMTVLATLGTVCSLTARNVAVPLLITLALPLITFIGIALLIPMVEQAAGPVIWLVSGVGLIATRAWTRRSVSTLAVGSHFIVVHLAMTSLASCWTFDGRKEIYPVCAMHPGFLTLITLDPHAQREFHDDVQWPFVVLTYWGALAANFLWARRWAIRNFDRMAGRIHSTENPSVIEQWLQRLASKLAMRLRPEMAGKPRLR